DRASFSPPALKIAAIGFFRSALPVSSRFGKTHVSDDLALLSSCKRANASTPIGRVERPLLVPSRRAHRPAVSISDHPTPQPPPTALSPRQPFRAINRSAAAAAGILT